MSHSSTVRMSRQTLCLTCALLSSSIFLVIAFAVVTGLTNELDRRLSLAIHMMDTNGLDAVMKTFTYIGSVPGLLLALSLSIWLFYRIRFMCAIQLVVIVAVTTQALNSVLKMIFSRARPNLFEEILPPQSFSFPSGHAMCAVAIYGILVVVFINIYPRFRLHLIASGVVLTFFIGISRIYLGVHWMTDVVGGFSLGAAILSMGIFYFTRLLEKSMRST